MNSQEDETFTPTSEIILTSRKGGPAPHCVIPLHSEGAPQKTDQLIVSIGPRFSQEDSALQIKDLTCGRAGISLFQNLTYAIYPKEIIHIKGKNGCGKTTLLEALAGLLSPQDGSIIFQKKPLTCESFIYISVSIGFKKELSVLENLLFWAGISQTPCHLIQETLSLFQLDTLQDQLFGHLSSGGRQRLNLCRLFLSPKPLWLLDEPFVSLDATFSHLLEVCIKAHTQTGGMVILTTHTPSNLPMRTLYLEDFAPRMDPMEEKLYAI